jgi:hypothetical protein
MKVIHFFIDLDSRNEKEVIINATRSQQSGNQSTARKETCYITRHVHAINLTKHASHFCCLPSH